MAVPVDRGPTVAGGPPARLLNIILGVWLFISAWVWPHTRAQQTNTWICGALAVVFALIGLGLPWARYLNTLLAIWLFISAWALVAIYPGTIWNNVLVAIAIFIVSLVPEGPATAPPGYYNRPSPPRPA